MISRVSVFPPHIFPNPSTLHEKNKNPKIKKESKEKDSSPQTKSLWHWFLSLCTTSFAFICSFCLTNLFIQTGEGRPSSREHDSQAWLNGGWKCHCSMFLLHSGYKNSLGSYTSVAQRRFRTQQEKKKTQKTAERKNRPVTESRWGKVNGHKRRTHGGVHMEVQRGEQTCSQFMLTLIIPAHTQAAHPSLLWHVGWPLLALYVFVNCPCLFSNILRGRQGQGCLVGYMRGAQVQECWRDQMECFWARIRIPAFHFLIKMRQAEQNEQSEGKWGERKPASGSRGILIKALIVTVRAQRQNKNTGEEVRWSPSQRAGLTLQTESDWVMGECLAEESQTRTGLKRWLRWLRKVNTPQIRNTLVMRLLWTSLWSEWWAQLLSESPAAFLFLK